MGERHCHRGQRKHGRNDFNRCKISPGESYFIANSILTGTNGGMRTEETGISTNWILRLDADYLVTEALKTELSHLDRECCRRRVSDLV